MSLHSWQNQSVGRPLPNCFVADAFLLTCCPDLVDRQIDRQTGRNIGFLVALLGFRTHHGNAKHYTKKTRSASIVLFCPDDFPGSFCIVRHNIKQHQTTNDRPEMYSSSRTHSWAASCFSGALANSNKTN